MGSKASTPADNNTAIKINHPMFEIAQLIKDKQEQEFIKTQVRLANKKQFDAWEKNLADVPANESLMLPTAKYYTQEGMCGNSGVAHITYENFPYLLCDEISNRECLNKKLFEQNELWYLVYTLLSAALTYHRQQTKVGDIRPDNIFINEDGQVKVASVDSWPGQQTNYAKSFYQKQITYLSPEQIKDYQFGKMQQSVDIQLAETFSIGLTCLDAATLSESKTLYSKNFKFNYEKLEGRINQFKKYGYSQLLTLTIQNMCEVDTEYRSTSRDILNWLSPHEDAIINLEDFQVQGLPQKIKLVRQRDQTTSKFGSISSQVQQGHQVKQGSQMQQRNQVQQGQQMRQGSQGNQIGLNSQFNYANSSYTPPTYTTQSGITVPPYNQPVQITSYQPTSTMFMTKPQTIPSNVQINTQPQSYQVPNTQSQGPYQGRQAMFNYYAVNLPSVNTNQSVDPHKFTLDKIDQQLQESRKMFPQ